MRMNYEKNEDKNPFLKGRCMTTRSKDEESQNNNIDLDVKIIIHS